LTLVKRTVNLVPVKFETAEGRHMGFFIAVLWFIGFILTWHVMGPAGAVIAMTVGPLVVAGLFSSGKSR
jgi:hypothetical protein